jgi:methionyl aminopeptidase
LEEAGRDAHRAPRGAQRLLRLPASVRRRYPAHTCISVNEEVVHGIPSLKRVLREGDIVSLDIVVEYNGYIGDNAARCPSAGHAPEVEKLLRVTREALGIGIRRPRSGNRIGDISQAIQEHVEGNGFSVVRDMVGHGVGRDARAAEIPNFGRRGTGDRRSSPE